MEYKPPLQNMIIHMVVGMLYNSTRMNLTKRFLNFEDCSARKGLASVINIINAAPTDNEIQLPM